MITFEPISFIKEYLTFLDGELKKLNANYELSYTQRVWLGFCLMGILMTNTVSWAKFERLSLGAYTKAAISWMFRHSKIPWNQMLKCSTSSQSIQR